MNPGSPASNVAVLLARIPKLGIIGQAQIAKVNQHTAFVAKVPWLCHRVFARKRLAL